MSAAPSLPPATLGIVLFGTRYLADVVPTVLALDYPNLRIALLDQGAPHFAAAEWLRRHAPALLADSRVSLATGPNLYHSGGHNFLIRQARATGSQFYFAGSNDLLYAPDVLTQLARVLLTDQKIGSVQPKLRQWQPAAAEPRTTILDSTGLAISAAHRCTDRGQGQTDGGQFDQATRIFGVSAALAGYRLAALADVAGNTDAVFDPALHYKNDVDLAYRLAAAGYGAAYVPAAVAWHARQLGRWQPLSGPARQDSFFGQLAVLYKNFTPRLGLRITLATFAQLFLRVLFMLGTQPVATCRSLRRLWQLRGVLAARRGPRRVQPAALAKLWR